MVNLPTSEKAAGCKWVFAGRFNFDGSVAHLKACLPAKGYAQIYEVDYYDIFSLIAKST